MTHKDNPKNPNNFGDAASENKNQSNHKKSTPSNTLDVVEENEEPFKFNIDHLSSNMIFRETYAKE